MHGVDPEQQKQATVDSGSRATMRCLTRFKTKANLHEDVLKQHPRPSTHT